MPPNELLQACANILAAHSSTYRQWSNEDRLKMLQWYADMGLIIIVEDPERAPNGIQRDLSFCLVRFLPDIQSSLRAYFSDPSGDIVFFDYVYKGSNKGYIAMFLEGFKKWCAGPERKYAAFHREHREDGSYR